MTMSGLISLPGQDTVMHNMNGRHLADAWMRLQYWTRFIECILTMSSIQNRISSAGYDCHCLVLSLNKGGLDVSDLSYSYHIILHLEQAIVGHVLIWTGFDWSRFLTWQDIMKHRIVIISKLAGHVYENRITKSVFSDNLWFKIME